MSPAIFALTTPNKYEPSEPGCPQPGRHQAVGSAVRTIQHITHMTKGPHSGPYGDCYPPPGARHLSISMALSGIQFHSISSYTKLICSMCRYDSFCGRKLIGM